MFSRQSVLCLILTLFWLVQECRTLNATVYRQGSKFLHIEEGQESSSSIWVCANDRAVYSRIVASLHPYNSSTGQYRKKIESGLPQVNFMNGTITVHLIRTSTCKLLVITGYNSVDQPLSDQAIALSFTNYANGSQLQEIAYNRDESYIVLNPTEDNTEMLTTTTHEPLDTTDPQTTSLGVDTRLLKEFSKTQDYFVPVVISLLGILLVLVILGLLCQCWNPCRSKKDSKSDNCLC